PDWRELGRAREMIHDLSAKQLAVRQLHDRTRERLRRKLSQPQRYVCRGCHYADDLCADRWRREGCPRPEAVIPSVDSFQPLDASFRARPCGLHYHKPLNAGSAEISADTRAANCTLGGHHTLSDLRSADLLCQHSHARSREFGMAQNALLEMGIMTICA